MNNDDEINQVKHNILFEREREREFWCVCVCIEKYFSGKTEGEPFSSSSSSLGRCVWPRYIEQRAARDGRAHKKKNPRSSGRQCSVWRGFSLFFPLTYSASFALELWICFSSCEEYTVSFLSYYIYGLLVHRSARTERSPPPPSFLLWPRTPSPLLAIF